MNRKNEINEAVVEFKRNTVLRKCFRNWVQSKVCSQPVPVIMTETQRDRNLMAKIEEVFKANNDWITKHK